MGLASLTLLSQSCSFAFDSAAFFLFFLSASAEELDSLLVFVRGWIKSDIFFRSSFFFSTVLNHETKETFLNERDLKKLIIFQLLLNSVLPSAGCKKQFIVFG